MIKNACVQTWMVRLALPARVYLGMVFVLASIYKIVDPYTFGLSIATYQMLPLEFINIFAISLPVLEALVGVTLILGFFTKESAFLISMMMVLFIIALALALTKDLQISCGCFASQEAADEISLLTLGRDLLWLFLAGFVGVFDDGRYGVDRLSMKRKRT